MRYFACQYVVAALLGLAACQSHTGPPTATVPTPLGTPAPADPAVAPTNSPGTAYAEYRLLLPDQPDSLTLHLTTEPYLFEEKQGAGYFASYYGANGHPYALQSQPTTADSVVLFDISPEKAGTSDATGNSYWRLRQRAGGGLAGTVNGQTVQLRLVAPRPDQLTFATRYFADSAAAFVGEAHSPVAHFVLQTLLPAGGAPAVRQALADNILRDLHGDTLGGAPVLPLAQFYRQQRKQYFEDYQADATDSRPAPGDTATLPNYALRYVSQDYTYVLCQQGNLLSLAFYRYDYMGGAHGSYGTTGASYDLRTGRRLRYDDIFQPTAAARLPALLAAAVRPLVDLQPGEPLDKALFVKQLPVTHNVFLTNGGAEFIYEPYEIASYAQGEIRVFLPLAQLRPLLRDDLPLPTPAVAQR